MDIPGYKIEKLIAEGGMADVYLAIQESLDRRVALKILKRFDKPEQSERFINEGRIIASLYHPNIITIHDIGVVNDQHYISMEYLERGDLETRISQGIPAEDAVDLVATIGSCLELVHSKGIVHRDIKPANILFRKDDTSVLTDFGIAKQLNQDTNLTMDGTAMGSPDYLSPEQAACKPLDGRADIYSLGILFYEMLTGQKPYQGGSYIEIVMAHISAPIPSLPSGLEQYQELLERMIDKDPEKRFASVTEMIEYIDKTIRKKAGKGIWATITGLFRKARPSSPVTPDTAKTLQFPVEELSSDPNETSDDYSTADSRDPGRAITIYRVSLLVGITLMIVAGSISTLNRTADEIQPAASSSSTVEQASLAAITPASNPAPVVEEDIAPEELFIRDPKEEEIERYLVKAKAALKAYNLTVPAKNNAYYYYKKVLALDPGNKEAKQGRVEIANRYANLAEVEIDRYEYAKAKHYVNTGLGVQPGHRRLVALQSRTSAVKDVPKRWFKKIESVFN